MKLTTDRGIIKLYDGTVVYIVDIQYSHNGQTYWESKYNPNTHYYEGDGVTELGGHKYMRVKHANDLNYQLPMYITATDGDSPELRVDDKNLQWKLSQSTVWQTIYDLNLLKGDKGEEGAAGEGLHIDGGGALDTRPTCCETSTTSSGCSGCGGSTASTVSGVKTFVSFGNHKLVTADVGKMHTFDGINWEETLLTDVGKYVMGWGATESGGSLTGITVSINSTYDGTTGLTGSSNLTISAPQSPNGVQATATMQPTGYISAYNVNDEAFFTTIPVLTVTGNGTGAAANFNYIKNVGDVTISNGGSGYTLGDTFSIGTGTPATITVDGIGGSGEITSVSLNYNSSTLTDTVNTTIQATPISVTGTLAVLESVVYYFLKYSNTQVTITNQGSGYTQFSGSYSGTLAPISASFTVGDFDIRCFNTATVVITNAGSGYTSAPTITENWNLTGITLTGVVSAYSTAAGYTTNTLGQTVGFDQLPEVVDSTGKVYACADGVWSEEMDLMVTTGQVKVSASDTLAFLNQKVDDITIEAYDSGVGYEDNIRVKDDGINEDKIIASALGDGLTGGSGVVIEVLPSDFVGDESHGLETFTHTDTTTDIRVKPEDLISDGLELDLTDVLKPKIKVQVRDLTVPLEDGLTTYTHANGFDNLKVKAGDCIELDSNGTNVKADELSIKANGLTALKVYETDSNTLGIQAKHIHKNVVDETKGLKKANDTTGAIGVLLDATDDSLDVSALGLKVKVNGIQGQHLSDDILDNTTDNNGVGSGLILTHDEGLSVKLKDNGGILKDTDGLYLDTLDLTTDIANTQNLVVKSIQINNIVSELLHDDVNLNINAASGITVSPYADSASNVGTVTIGVDLAYLNANLTPVASATAWGDITGTLADQTDLKAALDLKIPYDTTVGNMRIASVAGGSWASPGLWLKSDGGNNWFKLYVNDAGQLYTDTN